MVIKLVVVVVVVVVVNFRIVSVNGKHSEIPRTRGGGGAWGDFQESNFQFGVVKSLHGEFVKNDLSKDDDSLVNTRHVQLN